MTPALPLVAADGAVSGMIPLRQAPMRVPPGGKGLANGYVMVAILPNAEPRHLRAMAADLPTEVGARS